MVNSLFGKNTTASYPISCQDASRKAENEPEDTTRTSKVMAMKRNQDINHRHISEKQDTAKW